jgi:N-acylneuraminate cytidylyltransferase/CMP-N,N'-diacetyllegionaminic acid synthase
VSVLAVVPARGGSKGIPRKNLAPLAGRPLISYTLQAARAAQTISDILVSTDDEEIAVACEREGVAVPYRRPAALAGDEVGMADTVLHVLDWWRAQHGEPELLVLLQPTSPLRSAADVDGTVAELRRTGRNSAISVHEVSEHPMECVRLTGGAWSLLERPPAGAVRRQDYGARFFFINGAVYAVAPEFLRTRRAFMAEGEETALYVMDRMRGIDIDDPEDLALAEAVLSHPRLRRRIMTEAAPT